MTNYWNESSTGTRVIIIAALAILACGLAALCVLGLGLLGVYQLPGSATPTPQVAEVEINRVAAIVVVVPTPIAGSPSAAVACRVDILAGPGEGYERLGVLEEGRVAEVTGVSQDGEWWVIKVAEANTTQGWVSARCLAVQSGENVTVVQPPPTPIPTPPPPAAITDWKGEYFNNRDLQGEPVLVRDDPQINFDWGTGSPAPEVPPDNFSARWTISRDLPAGAYRFNIWVDDGVRMWIDDILIVDGWLEGDTRNYVVDVNLAAGLHNGRVEYFEAVGNALITLNTGAVEPPPAAPTAPPGQPPQGPDAAISAPSQGMLGQPVTFDGSGSTGPNPIVTYRWGFGDGSTADAVTVQKTYESAGIYNVTLRVTDDQGLENEDTWQITIGEAPPPGATDTPVPVATDTPVPEANTPAPEATATPVPEVTDTPVAEQAPPSAALEVSPPSPVQVGQDVTFDASGSSPGSSPIASYQWDFGDGNSAAGGPQETHQYSAPGSYTATVTVLDENGLSSSASQEIQVGEAEPTPESTS